MSEKNRRHALNAVQIGTAKQRQCVSECGSERKGTTLLR